MYRGNFVYRSLSPGKGLRVSPGPATGFKLCPHMQSLEERHQAGNLFRSPFLQNTRAISYNNRGARYQETVAQFSAVPSTLQIRFPTPKPQARQGSILWLLALYRSLKTVSNPRKHGPSGIFLSRAGHPSPWAPAFRFLVCLESLSF